MYILHQLILITPLRCLEKKQSVLHIIKITVCLLYKDMLFDKRGVLQTNMLNRNVHVCGIAVAKKLLKSKNKS